MEIRKILLDLLVDVSGGFNIIQASQTVRHFNLTNESALTRKMFVSGFFINAWEFAQMTFMYLILENENHRI